MRIGSRLAESRETEKGGQAVLIAVAFRDVPAVGRVMESRLADHPRHWPKVQYAAVQSFGNLAWLKQVSYGAAWPDVFWLCVMS